jgi:threonine synthase
VTLAALQRAITDGTVASDDEVVLVITGNGIKTLDVLEACPAGLPEPIVPTLPAFEAWWEREAAA